MASATTNIASIQQSFMNNITQVDQQNCIATVSNSANNNVIIVNGANIKGDFTGVSSTTSTDATCLMVSNMDGSISNILSATLQQTNTSQTDWFNGFQFTADTNSFNINQSITNNISQINEATCSANTTTSVSNNYVYVTNATIGGDFIGVTDTANASANCNMTNTMKSTTYNQAQASATQSNTIQGMFVAMVAAFAAIIGIMVIGVIILFAVGSIGYVGYDVVKKPSQPGELSPEQSEEQQIEAAESLGLTPDVLANLPPPTVATQ
jgi:type IV secretory pathway VirB2 component (pilin)